MPASRACAGDRGADVLAVDQVLAAVARMAPVRILISVLLPAPFSPARHMTSPARSSNVDAVQRLDRPVRLAGVAQRDDRARSGPRARARWSWRPSALRLRRRRVEQRLDGGRLHVRLVRHDRARVEVQRRQRARPPPSRPRRRPGSRRSTGSAPRARRSSRPSAPRSPAGRCRRRRPGGVSAALLSLIARAAPVPDVLLSAKIPTRFGLAVTTSLTWLAAVLMSLLLNRGDGDLDLRAAAASPRRKPASRSLSVWMPATEDSIITSPDVLPCCLSELAHALAGLLAGLDVVGADEALGRRRHRGVGER